MADVEMGAYEIAAVTGMRAEDLGAALLAAGPALTCAICATELLASVPAVSGCAAIMCPTCGTPHDLLVVGGLWKVVLGAGHPTQAAVPA